MQFDAKAVCILNRLLSLLFIYYLVLGEITAFRHHGFGPSHYRQLIDLSSVAGSALLLPIWSNSCPFQLLTRYLITDPRDDPSLAGERAWPKQEIAASLSLSIFLVQCAPSNVFPPRNRHGRICQISLGAAVSLKICILGLQWSIPGNHIAMEGWYDHFIIIIIILFAIKSMIYKTHGLRVGVKLPDPQANTAPGTKKWNRSQYAKTLTLFHEWMQNNVKLHSLFNGSTTAQKTTTAYISCFNENRPCY